MLRFFLSIQRDGRVQRYPVHPGTKFGISPELWVSFPELNRDLLEKIIVRVLIICIDPANLMRNVLMFFQFFYELMF